ncbi:YbjN domain-containing protein [Corynebacterium tapiri]|uniref:YbjN domain-containing protein n=1 Tax=Corynebacterium tapiri TaxID=1448266 RepID=A0A5C4U509_9CORY|nr:YbjN domain-containing protein [Corynebacterium tapiri]TNL99360.1 hypothetical protein FHE74_03110 [Corynebacterium tapiri]
MSFEDGTISEVTLDRIRAAATYMGLPVVEAENSVVVPAETHVTVITVQEESPRTLSFTSRARHSAALADIAELAQLCNEWNHDRLGPTATLVVGDDGSVEVVARVSVLVVDGLSDAQVLDHMQLYESTSKLFFRELSNARPEFSDLSPDQRETQDQDAAKRSIGHRQHRGVEDSVLRNAVQQEEDTVESSIKPVTLDRILTSLESLGITRVQRDPEGLMAWINGIAFGFFVDNGPSFLVKGHWDPGLDPENDALRIFLLCNDLNCEKPLLKAYTHTDDDGLQVRIEYTASVVQGLNDDQLDSHVMHALNLILHALDDISRDATGSSAVDWP